jgi:hypothetical protein
MLCTAPIVVSLFVPSRLYARDSSVFSEYIAVRPSSPTKAVASAFTSYLEAFHGAAKAEEDRGVVTCRHVSLCCCA